MWFLFIGASPNLETRRLYPPKLKKENIGEKICCFRPMRKSGPAMYVENKYNKLIAHNYGHGGGGWSLAPGSAQYIVDKLKSEMKFRHFSKNEPIAVLGSGIIGLFTVLVLLQNGYRNITIFAEKFDKLPSNHAGGLWAPFHIGNISEIKDLIIEIGVRSYNFFAKIAKGENRYFSGCAKFMPAYFKEKNPNLEIFVNSILKPSKKVLVNFGHGNKKIMYEYSDIMIINTPLTLDRLNKEIRNHGVKYVKRKINSFDEVEQKIIVNCTGYGAKDLCNDNDMVSIQGHLIVLKKQNPKHLNYLLTVPIETGTINGFKVKRLYYIIPRQDPGLPKTQIGVIGGTLVEGAGEAHPNTKEFKKIIDRACKFYGLRR